VQTGTLRGALTGAVSAAAFYGVGQAFTQSNSAWAYNADKSMNFSGYAAKTLSHGLAGGVMAELQGGQFGHGFVSAGFSEALSPAIGGIKSTPMQAIAVAAAGGTASVLAGGKFANGAVTASFGFAFNTLVHAKDPVNDYDEDAERKIEPLRQRALDIVYRSPGEDGVVDMSKAEFNEVFDYEMARVSMRSEIRGGYENLGPMDFAKEAIIQGDSLFYGDNGNTRYRIDGSGPYLGGNLNYVNQGIVFAAAGRNPSELMVSVGYWNLVRSASPVYTNERMGWAAYGYNLWNQHK
jgi:hypothetical protein